MPLDAPTGPGEWRSFHSESNVRLAYEHWLAHVPLDPARVLPMSLGGAIGPQILRFGRAFMTQFDGQLDVAILGAGPDGHIASLFPDHPGLDVVDVCFAVHDSPKPPRERISLTLPTLNQTAFTFVLARGEAKAAMLELAYDGASELPLARLCPDGSYHWVLRRDAATKIVARWRDPQPNS